MRRKLYISLMLSLFLAWAVYGQSATASLTGVVHDASGAVVPNATVHATNVGTNADFQAVTNEQGQYSIRTMPVGMYRVMVEANGFKRFERSDVRLQVDEVGRIDATLEVGDLLALQTCVLVSLARQSNLLVLGLEDQVFLLSARVSQNSAGFVLRSADLLRGQDRPCNESNTDTDDDGN